jgi:hypothetical protein
MQEAYHMGNFDVTLTGLMDGLQKPNFLKNTSYLGSTVLAHRAEVYSYKIKSTQIQKTNYEIK